MKITRRQLSKLIREAIIAEAGLPPGRYDAIEAIEIAIRTMNEAADELEALHAQTHDKYSGYEPETPEIINNLRGDAEYMEEKARNWLEMIK